MWTALRRARFPARVTLALLAVFFFDELATGVAPTDASRIALDLGVAPGPLAGAVIAAYFGIAFAVEPSLLRAAERWPPRRALAGALAVLALIVTAASFVTSELALLVALALYSPASGLATSVAEGQLVESRPDAREQMLARAHFAGGLGDLLVPAFVALVAWRDFFRITALVALVLMLVVATSRGLGSRSGTDDEEEEGDPPRLRDALRNRTLVGWTMVASIAATMDEVATAFLAVLLHARFDGDVPSVALGIAVWTVGGLVGLAVLDRLLERARPMMLLAVAAGLALLGFGVLLVAQHVVVLCAVLAVLGACAATFHPIVSARTYAALPGHPGVVNAISAIFVPFDAAMPLALGALAGAHGATAPIVVLGLVPAVMLAIALRTHRAERERAAYPLRE